MSKRAAAVILGAAALLAAGSAPAATYQVDPVHSQVGFAVQHLVISEVHGVFKEFSGTVEYDGSDPATLKVNGQVKVTSLDTRNEQRDTHLRSKDFFDVAQFPAATFASTGAVKRGDQIVIQGKLTLHGVTKAVELPIKLAGPIKDPWGKLRLGIKASGTLNRQDFGVKWSQKLDSGGLVVADEVEVTLNVEAVQP
ncbi:MAG: YceI family protein [Kiritimatiellaeota bacterium]|nr:YceI family protein [Kiritimatiellota bacterium]